jgi:hypothetical protein
VAVLAITDLSYFDGALALWAVIAALLVGPRPSLMRRRIAAAA